MAAGGRLQDAPLEIRLPATTASRTTGTMIGMGHAQDVTTSRSFTQSLGEISSPSAPVSIGRMRSSIGRS